MKKNMFSVFSLVLLWLLQSCGANPNVTTELPLGKQWLQGLICKFPCWQNITPQETRFNDAKRILLNSNNEISFFDENGIDFQSDNNISGSITSTDNGFVYTISLVVLEKEIRLSDVVETIGIPAEIILDPGMESNYCTAEFLFPQTGTIVEATLDNKRGYKCQVSIDAGDQVFRILLVGRGFDAFIAKSLYATIDRLSWEGYGEYP